MYSIDTILLHFLGFVFGIAVALAILGAIAALLRDSFNKNRIRAQERRRSALQRAHNEREGYQSFKLSLGELKLSPSPFKSDQYFRIEFVGVITSPRGLFNSNRADWFLDRFIDAHVWGRDGESPGSWTPHNGLFFDSSASPATPFISERHLHRYVFAYRGTGAPLSIFLEESKSMKSWHLSSGVISVSTSPLSDKDRVLADRHATEVANIKPTKPKRSRPKKSSSKSKTKPSDTQVEVHTEAEGETGQKNFEGRLHKLSLEFANPNYSDDQWIKNHARKYAADLLKRKPKIESDYIKFHKDIDFIAHIKTEAPEVYKRAIWQFRALTEAERVDVESTERRRPAPTPEQFRERMMRRFQVQAEDHISRKVELETMVQHYRRKLEELGLDEDETEEEIQRFKDLLSDEDEDGGSFASV